MVEASGLILGLALALQVLTAGVSLHLARTVEGRPVWYLLCGAALLLAVRNGLALAALAGGRTGGLDPVGETLTLAGSLLLLVAVRSLADRLRSFQRAQEDLSRREAFFHGMVDAAGEGIWLLDRHTRILFVNRQLAHMLGYQPEEMVGRPLFHFMDTLARVEGEAVFRRLPLNLREKHDFRLLRKDGRDLWTLVSITAMKSESGWTEGILGVVTDITERREIEKQTRRRAQHDPLTGLPNRSLLADRLEQALALARRHGKGFAVLFVDLDGFKPINDSLGHRTGDVVLREVARRLNSRVRASDTVARFGGDEFVVVLQDLHLPQEAAGIAATFIELLKQPYRAGKNTCHLGATIGVSLFPVDGGSADTLLRQADAAMYLAKENGRGCYRFASPPPPEAPVEDLRC